MTDEIISSHTFEAFDTGPIGADARERDGLKAALIAAKSFSSNPKGWLLLICPRNSLWTSRLALTITSELLRKGQPAFYILVADLLDHLRATFKPDSEIEYDELFEIVKSVPVLVLDNLGAANRTSWAQEKLFQIVVHRHSNKLPTVITTTLLIDEIQEKLPHLSSYLKDFTVVNDILIMYEKPVREEDQRRGRSGGSR